MLALIPRAFPIKDTDPLSKEIIGLSFNTLPAMARLFDSLPPM